MTDGGSGLPRRHGGPAPTAEQALPPAQRHVSSFTPGPETVRRAREAVTDCLPAVGVPPASAFADAVLFVTSELVANVLRHAPRSPVMEVGITVAAGQLVVSVADTEPGLPDLSDAGMGAGLRLVAEVAADHDGEVGARPAADHDGKVVFVRFGMPS
ncbi:ATP-binding protein [Streptomyces sp. NPDC007901]|uniref:ATP-binding protein n=1 Tax=Streptomyces sp. NPDC007901 TaxID=3364785 RepID=UPI0036E3EBC7